MKGNFVQLHDGTNKTITLIHYFISRDVQLVRAEEEHFLEGIAILTQLEVMEKLIEEVLEEAMEAGGNLESVTSSLASLDFS